MLFLALYFNSLAKKANSNVVFADAVVIAVFDGFFDVILTQFGFEKRIHTDNLPLNSHQMDRSSDNLTLFWKKGVSTTALNSEFAYLEEDDDDTELDEDALADEMQKSEPSDDGSDPVINHGSSNIVDEKPQNGKVDTKEEDVRALAISNDAEEATTDTPVVAYKRLSKRNSSAMIFAPSNSGSHGPISNPTYDGMQCSQTIKPLDSIKVAIHVEMTQTPPLLRVLAANPFM
jgi:DIS3-like exonuclease 2 C terminal